MRGNYVLQISVIFGREKGWEISEVYSLTCALCVLLSIYMTYFTEFGMNIAPFYVIPKSCFFNSTLSIITTQMRAESRKMSYNNTICVEFILRPTVSRPVRLVSGSPLGPMTIFYPYPFFSDNCFLVLLVGRLL
jgi:hypothetical protein